MLQVCQSYEKYTILGDFILIGEARDIGILLLKGANELDT